MKAVADMMEKDPKIVGDRFREALKALAMRWIEPFIAPPARRARIYTHRGFDPRELHASGQPVVRGRVAHADRRGVKFKNGAA